MVQSLKSDGPSPRPSPSSPAGGGSGGVDDAARVSPVASVRGTAYPRSEETRPPLTAPRQGRRPLVPLVVVPLVVVGAEVREAVLVAPRAAAPRPVQDGQDGRLGGIPDDVAAVLEDVHHADAHDVDVVVGDVVLPGVDPQDGVLRELPRLDEVAQVGRDHHLTVWKCKYTNKLVEQLSQRNVYLLSTKRQATTAHLDRVISIR